METLTGSPYVKLGFSKYISLKYGVNATYFHAGGGWTEGISLPVSPSFLIGRGSNVEEATDYSGSFANVGATSIFAYDFCTWFGEDAVAAESVGYSTSFGTYAGYDYYWLVDDKYK